MASSATEKNGRSQRWCSFSLRSFFLFTTACAICFSVWASFYPGKLITEDEVFDHIWFRTGPRQMVVVPRQFDDESVRRGIVKRLSDRANFSVPDIKISELVDEGNSDCRVLSVDFSYFCRYRLAGWSMVYDYEDVEAKRRNNLMLQAIEAFGKEAACTTMNGGQGGQVSSRSHKNP